MKNCILAISLAYLNYLTSRIFGQKVCQQLQKLCHNTLHYATTNACTMSCLYCSNLRLHFSNLTFNCHKMSDSNLKNYLSTVKLVNSIPEKFQKQLIQLAVASFQNKVIDIESITFDERESYRNEQINDMLGLYMTLIKIFVHNNKEEFEEILLQRGFSQEFINKFPIKQENKAVIANNTYINSSAFSITWAIDISLSNSALNKKLPPQIIFKITLESGKQHVFSVDIHKFHIIRFNIANLLKELINLNNRKICS